MKQLLNKTTFIVDNRKNAGKTTFLNYALAGLRPFCKPAYLSIGGVVENAFCHPEFAKGE